MNVNIDIVELEMLRAALVRSPQIVGEELLSAMTEADRLLEREVKDLTPDNVVGHLKDSIFSRETALPAGALGEVGSPKPYAVHVELGARPHFPPVEALKDWVRLKLNISDEKRIGEVAFLVARKIASRGTLGVGMFHRTYAQRRGSVERIFQAAMGRIAMRLAGASS